MLRGMSRASLAALAALSLLAPPAPAQNSSAKVRAAPSALAARAGSAVPWRSSLEAALTEALASGKPVFWYVPTIAGSFMDRKPEVDRAMLAGPFSWPRLIALLDAHFVPVKAAADKELCERYGLRRIEFIEPGFLVLVPSEAQPAGEVRARHDRLSTLHPAWFEAQLAPLVGAPMRGQDPSPLASPIAAPTAPEEGSAEALYLAGLGCWRAKDEGAAAEQWRALCAAHPEHPLAWKAAMELEGHGPLARGLESDRLLPAAALVASGHGTQCGAGVYGPAEVWRHSLEYLLDVQRADGGFRDSIYDFGGTDGLPNVYVAVTSIAAIAYLEGLERIDAGLLGEAAALRERVALALDAALRYALDDRNMAPEDTDERVWAYLYRLRAAARYVARFGDAGGASPRPNVAALATALIQDQRAGGAWAHEYPNPFVTASALIALAEANDVAPLRDVSDAAARATAALLACRTDDGAYTYGQTRAGRTPRADLRGSVGRTPLGELALDRWAPASCLGLEKAVTLSFEHHHHLEPVRKYDDHTDRFAYGGFFYWYDVHARIEALARWSRSATDAQRAAVDAFRARQREEVLRLVEIDGTFIDSHEVGKAYGTALALWCLAELDE